MGKIGGFEGLPDHTALKGQRLDETHQGGMGGGALRRSALIGAVAQDHVGTNQPFGLIVLPRQTPNLQEGQELVMMLEDSSRETPQCFVPIRSCSPRQEAFIEKSMAMERGESGQHAPGSGQPPGIQEDPSQSQMGATELLRGIAFGNLAQFPEQVNPTLLLADLQPIVGAVEVADHDPLVPFAENLFGNCRSSAAIDSVVGNAIGDEGPEPVVDPGHLPAGLIHMGGRRSSNGFKQGLGLDLEPLSDTRKRLSDGSFGDGQFSQLLEAGSDLVEGQTVDVLEQNRLGQDLGTQIAVGDLLGGVGSREDTLTPAAIVPMPLEAGHLHSSRDQILLEMFRHFNGRPQPCMALRACGQSLLDDSVNLLRGRSGDSRMPRLLPGTFGTPNQQGQTEELFLGRIQPIQQTLVLLSQKLDLTLKVIDEGDKFVLGQVLRIVESSQNNLPSDRGVTSHYDTMAGSIKQNLLRTLN